MTSSQWVLRMGMFSEFLRNLRQPYEFLRPPTSLSLNLRILIHQTSRQSVWESDRKRQMLSTSGANADSIGMKIPTGEIHQPKSSATSSDSWVRVLGNASCHLLTMTGMMSQNLSFFWDINGVFVLGHVCSIWQAANESPHGLKSSLRLLNTRFDKKSNNNLAHLLDSLDSLRAWTTETKCWTQAAHFWGRYDNSYLILGNWWRKRSRKVVKVMKSGNFLPHRRSMDRLGLWWLGAAWRLWKWKLGSCSMGTWL